VLVLRWCAFSGITLARKVLCRHPWPSPVGSLRECPPRSSSRRLSDTPHHHSQRSTLPSTNAATAAAKLLKVESPTAFHHSACAPTLSTRGHSRMYFGRLETDNPANASGTTIHRATPSIDTNAAATSSQYSGARHQQRVLLFLALPCSSLLFLALPCSPAGTHPLPGQCLIREHSRSARRWSRTATDTACWSQALKESSTRARYHPTPSGLPLAPAD
jgi:hypothetical protein